MLRRGPARRSRSCARPTTPPGMVEPRETVEAVLDAGARPGGRRRGLRPVRPVVGAVAGRRRPAAGGHPHVLQDVVDGRLPARLPGRRRPRSWPSSRRSCCRTTSTPPSRSPAAWPCASRPRWRPGWRRWWPSGSGCWPALARLPVRRVAVGRQLRALPPRRRVDGAAVWQGLVERSVLVRDCSSWPRLDGCLRVTVGTPDEDDAFLSALEEVLAEMAVSRSRVATRSRVTKETSIEIRLDLDGTGAADVATGIPFFDHMLDQLGKPRRLRPRPEGHAATSTSTPTTRSRTSASPWASASGRRWATRPACAASPPSRVPLDEALIEVALDLSGRPFLVYEVEPGGDAARHARLRPPAGRGVLAGVRHVGRHHPPPAHAQRQEHPPHPGGVVQGRGPGPARRGAGRGRRACRPPRARCDRDR